MKEQDHLKSGIDKLIPVLGWLTLIGIALIFGFAVLGVMIFTFWLAILFLIKIIPIIILAAIVLVVWKLIQDRKQQSSTTEDS